MGTSRQQDIAQQRKDLIAERDTAYMNYRRTGSVDDINRVDRKLAATAQELYRDAAGICCRDYNE